MNRKSLFFLCLAALVVFVAARWDWQFDWSLFFTSLWHVHPVWLAASVAATLLSYVIRAFRWQVLLNPLKEIQFQSLLSTTLVGFSAIYVLGRAGELVRPMWLTQREHVPFTASMATIVVERFFDSVMLVMLFAYSMLLVDLSTASASTLELMKNAAWVLLTGSIVAIACLLLFRSNIDWIVRHVPFMRVAELLKSFSQGLSFLQRSRSFGMATAHSMLLWMVIALQFWFMLLGMRFDFSLSAATLVLVVSGIGSIAQIPGIGGGFQAGYIFSMTTFFHVPAEQALATSLVAWAFSYVPTVAVAGIYMMINGLSLKDFRTAAAE